MYPLFPLLFQCVLFPQFSLLNGPTANKYVGGDEPIVTLLLINTTLIDTLYCAMDRPDHTTQNTHWKTLLITDER